MFEKIKNKQFSTKLIVFICILIVGIILILVDFLIVRPTLGHFSSGYLTLIAGFIIFLGVMMMIRGLLLLRRARRQEN